MPVKLLVPRLGEGVDELTIVRWLKKEGDAVKELEPIVEVETDKVVTEIPSPAGGIVLKLLVNDNQSVKVDEVMAWIGVEGETIPEGISLSAKAPVPILKAEADVSEKQDLYVEHPPSPRQREVTTSPDQRAFISPVVRKIAFEHKVDLSSVQGTGLGGRITKEDILQHLREKYDHTGVLINRVEAGKLIPVTTIRRQIAQRMQQSKQISPHVMTVMEADLSKVVTHRKENLEAFAVDGARLTYTAYFIAAIASGLKAMPLANSTWTEEGILIHPEVNIGMATSLGEEGLIVPVIRQADELSLLGIARKINDLSTRARTKKLSPEEVKQGTFTLTNHGNGRSLFAMPIINQPQCGILGTGMIQKRAVVISDPSGNDAIAIRPMVFLSFVFDHRILDGASADSFLDKVKSVLENWS